MSTRGTIAMKKDGSWEGRYHHFDSYPAGLGKALWESYHGYFGKDVRRMVQMLVYDHPGGWSSIVQADWSLPIGYQEPSKRRNEPIEEWLGRPRAPQCYCHGDRTEDEMPLSTPKNAGTPYVYVIDPETKNVQVLEMTYTPDYKRDKYVEIGRFNLEDPEPDWKAMGKDEE